MVKTIPTIADSASPALSTKARNPFKLIEKNYQNNLASDYTEKIEQLDKAFDYANNSTHYWSEPELSLLYGTPLYEAASPAQKLALNHLYWVSQYNFTALGEAETVHYNQITAGSLSRMGGSYEAIAHQLEHEATQERSHIHAFYKVTYQTMRALLGKQAFASPIKKKPVLHRQASSQLSTYQYFILRRFSKVMLKGKEQYRSQYLERFEEENKLSKITNGFFHGRGTIPQPLLRFFAFNWGSSPFLACQYYTLRFMGNLLLKNIEHHILLYFKKLQKQGQFVPVPTAISHYHFLDEAFHTTTSQFLAQELYKHLPTPTAYEETVANMAVYLSQRSNFNGISGVVNKRCFRDDRALMVDIYRLFQSPLFNMSRVEALRWMEQCFCQEHEGFHLSAKSYQHLLSRQQQFCDHLDYLWPINRKMQIMASGNSIEQAIQNNVKTFEQFSRSLVDP
jgi:hypothetical protein